MTISETVYTGRDNTVDLLLKSDGEAQDLSSVTRMRLVDVDGAFDIDSDTSAGAFDWDNGTTGKVIIAIGGEGIAAGRYGCRLIVYDPTNDDGIVWGRIVLTVYAAVG